MRLTAIALLLAVATVGAVAFGMGEPQPQHRENAVAFDRLANAIWFAEGAHMTTYPYGIVSVNVDGDPEKGREICLRTIRHAWKDWLNQGSRVEFIDFLADRYCPPSVDREGNRNWKRNVRYFMEHPACPTHRTSA